ncbi:MAG: hypothetical protein QS748_04430 [Candidatus Endonucleobacter bathymodioli]|uniref:Uncharacterized protein n=1 Tax=Candidatus Endonucleibacter bathymodioli TaxID=539814 RepID=A0AA90NKW4_9GAMM|nr:hypothetical protein [Candidatus Endonucleobacter bathymodioli]
MKKSVKAALLSALVIPGAGHILLKKYWIGIALSSSSAAAMCILLLQFIERVQQVLENIRSGEIDPQDMHAVMDIMMSPSVNSGSLVTITKVVLVVAWIIGIGHSYLLAWKQERK